MNINKYILNMKVQINAVIEWCSEYQDCKQHLSCYEATSLYSLQEKKYLEQKIEHRALQACSILFVCSFSSFCSLSLSLLLLFSLLSSLFSLLSPPTLVLFCIIMTPGLAAWTASGRARPDDNTQTQHRWISNSKQQTNNRQAVHYLRHGYFPTGISRF